MDVIRAASSQARAGMAKEFDEHAGVKPSGAQHLVDYPGDEPLPAKAPAKAPTHFAAAADLADPKNREEFKQGLVDTLVEQVEAERAKPKP